MLTITAATDTTKRGGMYTLYAKSGFVILVKHNREVAVFYPSAVSVNDA